MVEDDPVNQLSRATLAQTTIRNSIVQPRQEQIQGPQSSEIGIIEGLSPEKILVKINFLLLGFKYNYITNKWEQYRKPIMNEEGIGNILACMQSLTDNVAFSFYAEKDIPRLVYHFFATNYPVYICYAADFELDYKDYNVVESILFHFALSVYQSGRHGGHRNTVRGTLSENVMAKLFEGKGSEKKKGIGGFLNNFWGRKDKDG